MQATQNIVLFHPLYRIFPFHAWNDDDVHNLTINKRYYRTECFYEHLLSLYLQLRIRFSLKHQTTQLHSLYYYSDTNAIVLVFWRIKKSNTDSHTKRYIGFISSLLLTQLVWNKNSDCDTKYLTNYITFIYRLSFLVTRQVWLHFFCVTSFPLCTLERLYWIALLGNIALCVTHQNMKLTTTTIMIEDSYIIWKKLTL